MTARTRTVFTCSSCGATAPRWSGRCAECGEWNTLVEEVVERSPRGTRAGSAAAAPVVRLSEVATAEAGRMGTGYGELDRLLGGGIVPGALYLVGGEPGVG